MALLLILNVTVLIAASVFIMSQVILPMFTDYKYFWIFDYFKRKKKFQKKLDKANTDEIDEEFKRFLDDIDKRNKQRMRQDV